MRTLILGAGVLAAVLAAAPAVTAQQQQAPSLPPGNGRDVVAQACTLCHTLNTVLQLRQGADGWRSIVDYMVLHGAQLTPQQADQAVEYLATNFGPGVNVPQLTTQVTLPDGRGKDLVATNCVICHGLDRIAASRRTPSDWQSVLARMQFLGAPVSNTDRETIAAYLDTHFGTK
jgi:mono/diheme cytochrome c family protein